MKKVILTLSLVFSSIIIPCFAITCTTNWTVDQYVIDYVYVDTYTNCATFECETEATEIYHQASLLNDIGWGLCCLSTPLNC